MNIFEQASQSNATSNNREEAVGFINLKVLGMSVGVPLYASRKAHVALINQLEEVNWNVTDEMCEKLSDFCLMETIRKNSPKELDDTIANILNNN